MSQEHPFTQNRLASAVLGRGMTWEVRLATVGRTRLTVEEGALSIATQEETWAHLAYDAVWVRPDVIRLEVTTGEDANTLLWTWVIDQRTGAVIQVVSAFSGADLTRAVVEQRFTAGLLDNASGPAPGPSRELLGQRVVCDYGNDLAFEQVYLSSAHLAWQQLTSDMPRAGIDSAQYWKLADDLFVVGFCEDVYQTASVFVLDLSTRRSTSSFLSAEGGTASYGPLGGRLTPLGGAAYPPEWSPR